MTGQILIAGGGSSGHVFPGLAVMGELQTLGVGVHWLGAQRGLEVDLVGQRGVPITLLQAARAPSWAAITFGVTSGQRSSGASRLGGVHVRLVF